MALTEVPLSSPISPDMFGMVAALLLLLGFAATAFFFANPLSSGPSKNSVGAFALELVVGAAAALLLGHGSLFLFLSAGVYV
jgi:hypothetical protein